MTNKKHIFGIIIVGVVALSMIIFLGGPILFDQEPSNDDQNYEYEMFYDYPELSSGSINFTTSPLAMDAIEKIDPLGNLNPDMGHSFPTTHSGLWFNYT